MGLGGWLGGWVVCDPAGGGWCQASNPFLQPRKVRWQIAASRCSSFPVSISRRKKKKRNGWKICQEIHLHASRLDTRGKKQKKT